MKTTSFRDAMELWNKPERVILVTCMDSDQIPKVMTVGWKMRTSFQPPMFAIAISEKRKMHECLSDSSEFVIAVPGADLADEVLICGSPDEAENRFERCGFKTREGLFVKSPIIENCLANFECKIVHTMQAGDHTIFVGEVLASWANERPTKNLVIVGENEGYESLAEDEPYKIGVIKG